MRESKAVAEGIIRGGYCYYSSETLESSQIHLLGSGSIMLQVLAARNQLEALDYRVSVWSITSYNELYREAESCERQARLHPTEAAPQPYVTAMFADTSGVYVAASDYMKTPARGIAPRMPASYQVLGTDGYGLSESREELRSYFEISADHICHAALVQLLRTQTKGKRRIQSQIDALGINPNKSDPTLR